MKRVRLLAVAALVLILAGAYFSYAQYTGFDIEEKKPPSLFPVPGPGASAIVRELQKTNRLLLEQNQLISEQNRLLRENAARVK